MTAPITVDAVMALLEPVLEEASDNGNGREPGGWLATKEAEIRAAVELLAQQARDKALEDAADAIAHEASLWRGEQDVTDFRLSEARIRAMK